MNKTCIIIAGPTAVGKTSAAISVAKHFSTEIISSDSRQCYTELNIGVAKPSVEQLAQFHHHFINSHSIHQAVSAADFESYAVETAASLFKHANPIIMVGGTGLYMKAFCDGLDEIPKVSEAIRSELQDTYQQLGIGWLAAQLAESDPQFYEHGEMQNPQRMLRALEVVRASGRSILSYYTALKRKREFDVIKIGLELPRPALYENINHRTEEMISSGLLNEVQNLMPFKNLNALQTVGYREIFSHLEGSISFERAVELIKQNTRHYAKRQMTWFKKDEEFIWARPDDFKKVISLVEERLRLPKG